MTFYISLSLWLVASLFTEQAVQFNPSESEARKAVYTSSNGDTASRTIHIYVALCDNVNQGIVPVPAKIGNGQDPFNNLYWGCAYGIKSYFKKSAEWTLLKSEKLDSIRMERLYFKHKTQDAYIIADAYNGKYIKLCTEDFLSSACGKGKNFINLNTKTLGIGGNADLVAYIGHDGLMDFEITNSYINTDKKKRDVIVLACYSKHYFSEHLKQANVNPLVWTSGLMCPEAYTIHDALSGWMNKEGNEDIRSKAAKAYSTYQKCGISASKRLLVTGW